MRCHQQMGRWLTEEVYVCKYLKCWIDAMHLSHADEGQTLWRLTQKKGISSSSHKPRERLNSHQPFLLFVLKMHSQLRIQNDEPWHSKFELATSEVSRKRNVLTAFLLQSSTWMANRRLSQKTWPTYLMCVCAPGELLQSLGFCFWTKETVEAYLLISCTMSHLNGTFSVQQPHVCMQYAKSIKNSVCIMYIIVYHEF